VEFLQADGKTPIPYAEHPLIRVLERGDTAEDDVLVLRNASGETYSISSKYGPIRNPNGDIVAGIFSWMDISPRKNMENELEEATRRLKRSNQALEAFSFSAAHDLKDPLTKIIAFSHMLENEHRETLGSSGQDLLTRIRNAAQRMRHLIDKLLEYSRFSYRPVVLSPVDLNQVLNNVVSEMESVIGGIGAQIQMEDLPTIQADALLMEHVFQNLIGNALKFRRSDIPIQVRIYQETPHPEHQNWVRIVVEDNGIGFNMEHANSIFQPFLRLHGLNAYEGSGLGLAISKQIIEQHGGKITASSQPGKGSVFFLDLPNE
jgi:light-regulated signal transduction histidine kinase (bacteriophytochrome)